MTLPSISIFAIALLLSLAIACSSESSPAEPARGASAQSAAASPPTATEPARSPSPQSAAASPPTATEPARSPSPQSAAASQPTATPTEPPPAPTPTAEPEEQDLEIVTLLPFDAIPAVLDPQFVSAQDADAELTKRLDDPDDALVLGLDINGDSRAYYVPSLSAVEIINDTVGGQPLAVTW